MPTKLNMTPDQAYWTMKEYEKKDDISGMVDFVCDLAASDAEKGDNAKILMIDGVTKYFEGLAELNNGEIDPKSKDIVARYLFDVQKRRVDSVIGLECEINRWEEKIKNGEVKEVALVKDDPKLVRDLANDVVVFKTPTGMEANVTLTALNCLLNAMVPANDVWKKEFREGEFSDLSQRKDGPLIESIVADNSYKKSPEEALKIVQKIDVPSVKGEKSAFYIDRTRGFENGKPIFTKLPKKIEEMMALKTPEAVEAKRDELQKKLDDIKLCEEAARGCGTRGKQLKASIEETSKDSTIARNDKFQEMCSIIDNLSRIGVDYKISIGGSSKMPTNVIMHEFINKDLKKLKQLEKEIVPELDEIEDQAEFDKAEKMLKDIKTFTDNESKKMKRFSENLGGGSLTVLSREVNKDLDFLNKRSEMLKEEPAAEAETVAEAEIETPEDKAERIADMIDEKVGMYETRPQTTETDKMINEAATKAAYTLAAYAKDDPAPLTPAEQMSVRKAMAAMAYSDFLLTDAGGKIYDKMVDQEMTPMEYDRFVINKLANSPKFIKAASNITHDSIVDFMTDMKAGVKLMEKYGFERTQKGPEVTEPRAAAKDMQKTNDKGPMGM